MPEQEPGYQPEKTEDGSELQVESEATKLSREVIGELQDLDAREQGFLARLEKVYHERLIQEMDRNDPSPESTYRQFMLGGMTPHVAQEAAQIPEIRSVWSQLHAKAESGELANLPTAQLQDFRRHLQGFVDYARNRQDQIEHYVELQEAGEDYLGAIRSLMVEGGEHS